MQILSFNFILGLFAIPLCAVPVSGAQIYDNGLVNEIHITDNLLLFDAVAFPDPRKPGEVLADIQTYASSRVVSLSNAFPGQIKLVVKALKVLKLEPAKKVTDLDERLELFLAIGLPEKSEQLIVDGCSASPMTGTTGLHPHLGMSDSILSLGKCGSMKQGKTSIKLDMFDTRKISSTIYFSPNSGFGVISDIDDTIRMANVLDKARFAKSTLLDKPMPVPGMPELYASLAKSLQDPQFVYIDNSPFQLYPFFNDLVKSSYAASAGPIWTQNMTFTDPTNIVDKLRGEGNTMGYKISQIDRLHAMYPNKKWLAIGDSADQDPEVYAEIYKKYPKFISCIWIRKVPGAANDKTRFDAAFKGIPKPKYKVFTDKEIPSLSSIHVADGKCKITKKKV